MRILQLISSGGLYGAEKMLISLSKSLAGLECETVICVFDNRHVGQGNICGSLRAEGLTTEPITCSGKIDFHALRSISDCIRKYNIDVVHTHGYKADIYGFAAAHSSHTPILATSHYWTRRTLALRFYARFEQVILRRFDAVVAVSQEIASEIVASGTRAEKVLTIDNGIDLRPFVAPAPSLIGYRKGQGPIVGAVGRLEEQKGFEYFLHAIPAILHQHPDATFLMVGEGSERACLEALARKLRITENVVFVGQRSDMPNVYASFDIFVLPSIDEGMPIALLEAMATARPVVATRVGAVPKLVIDNQTGLLVETRDVQALEGAVLRLLGDREKSKALGANGRRWVEQNYSAHAMAERYLKLYQRVKRNHADGFSRIAAHV